MGQLINSEMGAKAWLMLLLLSFVWGGSFFFNAILVRELPPITIVFLRVSLAAVFLWVYIAAKNIPVPKTLNAWWALFAMGLLNNVIPFCLIVWGQTAISSSLASILNGTVPMMTVILAAALLKDENINKLKIAGVIVGFLGTVWIIAPDLQSVGGKQLWAQLAILAAALSYSFAAIFGRRFAAMQIHPVMTATGQVTASAIITLPIMLIVDKPQLLGIPSTQVMLATLALALASTAFAYILYFSILSMAGATNLALVTFLVPIWAVLFGIWLLGESLSIYQLAGVALVALGLSLIDGRLWRMLKRQNQH